MANESKKVSVREFDKICKDGFADTVTYGWHGCEITVKRYISLESTMRFVDSVVSVCFSDGGEYMPEIMDFAIKSKVVEEYSNVSLPDNIEHRHKLIYGTDIVESILDNVSEAQVREIVSAIGKKVDHIRNENAARARADVDRLVASFESINSHMEDIFGAIDGSGLSSLIGAIQNGRLDEEKVVSAYLAQRKTAE